MEDPPTKKTALLATRRRALASATISRIPQTDTKMDLTSWLVAKPESINRSVRAVATTAAASFL
jgi:hypothetical protein